MSRTSHNISTSCRVKMILAFRRIVPYERLLAAGKVKKVALTACMHKLLTILNALLKHRTPWQPQEVQN